MDWTALRDLVAVAETGSLSGAARKLGVSQPTIGRRIEQLEGQLDSLLFIRTPQGLNLTRIGEQILHYAQSMSEDAVAIERVASGADQRLEGVVRITLTDLMGNDWLPTKLQEFHQQFPGLRLEIAVENRNLDLIKREADLAIRFTRPRQLDLVVRKSVRFNYGLYASTQYLHEHGHPSKLQDLKKHYFISYDETIIRNAALKRLETMFDDAHILQRYTSNAGVLAALKQDFGMGALGCIFSDREADLERIMTDRIEYGFDIWVATHIDLYKSARIKAVFNFMIEKLSEDAALFFGQQHLI